LRFFFKITRSRLPHRLGNSRKIQRTCNQPEKNAYGIYNTVTQAALANSLNNGTFELHLRHLRKALYTRSLRYLQAVAEHFPEDRRVTRSQGGFTLWIEMNKKMNAYKLHKRALKQKSTGSDIFCSFENCFRMSYGAPWSEQIGQGLQTLGKLIHEMR
jgi:DNA-binding transcriptional MocR family regulator